MVTINVRTSIEEKKHSCSLDNGITSSNLLHDLRRGSDQHPSEMLSRSTSQEITLLDDSNSFKGLENDSGGENRFVTVVGSRFKSGNNTLTLSNLAVRNQPSGSYKEKKGQLR